MRNRKFKYLYQLVYTSFLLVIIPILLFYLLVWNRSYKEIKNMNTEYYNYSLSTFMDRFTVAVDNFKSEVIAFSVKSKSEQDGLSAFYYGTPIMQQYAYYYGEASLKLRTYGKEKGYDDFGVYYYDEDVLLINGSKYTVDQYLSNVLRINKDDLKLFEDFYSKERYFYNQIMYVPICDGEGKAEKFLLGVCTNLGQNREEVIMFCQIDYEHTGMSYISSSGKGRENYYVIDNTTERILFSVGATKDEYLFLKKALVKGVLQSGEHLQEKKLQGFFLKNHGTMNLTFAVDTTGDKVQNSVVSLYESVKMLFLYITIMMLILVVMVIYINYKPVTSLLKEIKADTKHEFDAILYSWQHQEKKLSEQRMVIMDLLMNQLLYGVPISEKNIERLGLSNKITCYCVFVIEDYVLKVSEMDEVIQTSEDLFGTLLFATDIIGKYSTVLVALMENDSAEELGAWIEKWLQKHIKDSYGLKKGLVVHKMNEIQKSFDACMEKGLSHLQEDSKYVEESTGKKTVLDEVKYRAVLNDKLKEKVLAYMEKHFTDSEISQQQLADHFQVSVYTLSKMFNNQIGIGFSEYLNSKRIEYAKELLCTTDISVKEIAVMVGIPSDNYFSKIFKKYQGRSPLTYREETHR